MSVKIVYEDIAAGADEDAAVSAPGAAEFTAPARLPFGGSGDAIAVQKPAVGLQGAPGRAAAGLLVRGNERPGRAL